MDTEKNSKIIAFIYSVLAFLVLVIAGGFFVLPDYIKKQDLSAEHLLADAMIKERYITTDMISDKIINQDPSFKLVDVRDEESYKEYALPNAVNIPLSMMGTEENKAILDQDQYDMVFYSNDNFHADQAWVIGKRLGYKNLYVLKGGVNEWYETIINPKKPSEDMPETAFVTYSTRKAASMYFGVAYPDLLQFEKSKVVKAPPKKAVTPKKKKKKKPEGGC